MSVTKGISFKLYLGYYDAETGEMLFNWTSKGVVWSDGYTFDYPLTENNQGAALVTFMLLNPEAMNELSSVQLKADKFIARYFPQFSGTVRVQSTGLLSYMETRDLSTESANSEMPHLDTSYERAWWSNELWRNDPQIRKILMQKDSRITNMETEELQHTHPTCSDDGDQALRVVAGGLSDEDFRANGGTVCPYCRKPDSCYHDDFYIRAIPIKDGVELHASVCDGCKQTWYDVVDCETGLLYGTRTFDFDGHRPEIPTE